MIISTTLLTSVFRYTVSDDQRKLPKTEGIHESVSEGEGKIINREVTDEEFNRMETTSTSDEHDRVESMSKEDKVSSNKHENGEKQSVYSS